MASFRDVQTALLDRYMDGVIEDDEFLLLEILYEDHGGWCNRCTTVKSNNTSIKKELTDLP